MAALSTIQFIDLYERDHKQAFLWLQENNTEATTLFTSLNEITKLCTVFQKKIADNESDVDKELTADENTKIYNRRSNDITQPIDKILESSSGRIARLCTNSNEYLAIAKLCMAFANKLFTKAPEHIIPFFTTYDQFITIVALSPSFSVELFTKAAEHFKPLFTTFDQLLELLEKSTIEYGLWNTVEFAVAQELLKEVRIKNLVATRDQLIQLSDKCLLLAKILLEEQRIQNFFTAAEHIIQLPAKNASLAHELFNLPRIRDSFTTFPQLMSLLHKDRTLARKLLAEQRIRDLITEYDQVMQLVDLDSFLGESLLNEQRILNLVSSYNQFLQLCGKSHSLVLNLFKAEPQRIADLLDSEAKLLELAKTYRFLALRICEFKQCTLPEPTIPSEEKKEEEVAPSNMTPSSEINSSFVIKGIAALAVASGLIAIMVGILLAQPTILLGLVISGVGALALYGFFSQETANDSSNKLQSDYNSPWGGGF